MAMQQIYLVASQTKENQKRNRLYNIQTCDYVQFHAIRRAGYKHFAFEDQKHQRTTNIIIEFQANNLERFSAHIYEIVRNWEYKKVCLS